jgi:cation transporter-like permease
LVQRVPSKDHMSTRSEPFYPTMINSNIDVDIPNKHQFTMDPRPNHNQRDASDSDDHDDGIGSSDSTTDKSYITDLLLDEDAHDAAHGKKDLLNLIGDVVIKQPKVKKMLKNRTSAGSRRSTPDRSGMPLAPGPSSSSNNADANNVFSLLILSLPVAPPTALTRDRTSSFASTVSTPSFEQFKQELDEHQVKAFQQQAMQDGDDGDDVDDHDDAYDIDITGVSGGEDASLCGTYDDDSDVGAPADLAAKRASRQRQKQQLHKEALEKLEMTLPRAPRPTYVSGGGSVGQGLDAGAGMGSQGGGGQAGAVPKSIKNRKLSNLSRMAEPKLTSSKSRTHRDAAERAAAPNKKAVAVGSNKKVGSNGNNSTNANVTTHNHNKKSKSDAVPSQGQAQTQAQEPMTNNNDVEDPDEEISLIVDAFDFDKYNTNTSTAPYSHSTPIQSQSQNNAHANPPHSASVVMEFSPHAAHTNYDHAGAGARASYGAHVAYPHGAYPSAYGHQHPYLPPPQHNGEPHGQQHGYGHPYAPTYPHQQHSCNPYGPPSLPQFGAYPGPGQHHLMGALGQYPHAHHGQGHLRPHPRQAQSYPPRTYCGQQCGEGGYYHAPYASPRTIGGIPFSSTCTSTVTGESSGAGAGAGIPTTQIGDKTSFPRGYALSRQSNLPSNQGNNSEMEPLVLFQQAVTISPPDNAGTTATTTAEDSIPYLPPSGTLLYATQGPGHGLYPPQGYGATGMPPAHAHYPGSGRPPYGYGYQVHASGSSGGMGPNSKNLPPHLYGGSSRGSYGGGGGAAAAPANGTGTGLLRRRSSLAGFVHRPKQMFDEHVDSVFSSARSLSEADEQLINQDAQKYLDSGAVSRAFPERFVALCITLLVELPTLFMIYNGSTQLCGLLGRTKYQLLMALLPLTSAISGNCGLQGSTLTTRAVSHGQMTKQNFAKWLQQEVVASLLMGVGMAAILGLLAFYCTTYDWVFATAIAMAQIFSIVTAGLTGTMAPLLFTFIFHRDSGKWCGPLETAIQDIVGSFAMVVLSYHFLVLVGPREIEPHDMCAARGGEA